MRYIIMANGKGRRWGEYGGIPKHLIRIDGETLLERTVRLVQERDWRAEIIVSSADERCETEGAVRHVPEQGEREIDRFCCELICNDCCFLYGDTFYTKRAMERIVRPMQEPMRFYGTSESIVAVKANDGATMRRCIDSLCRDICAGVIEDAKGWQLYHRYAGMPVAGRAIGSDFEQLYDETTDFNWPEDYLAFENARSR